MQLSSAAPNLMLLTRWITTTALLFLFAVGVSIYFIALPVHGRYLALNALAHFFFIVAALCILGLFATFVFGFALKYLPDNFKATGLLPAFILSFACYTASATQAQRLYLEDNMRITYGADYIAIRGSIAPSLAEQLKHSMAADYRPARVYLANQGGGVEASIAAADFLKSRGATTAIVDGDCASSCAFMALLFPIRLGTSDARLGFHDMIPYATSKKKDTDKSRELLSARLISAGIPADVVSGFFKTKELRYPSREQLFEQKLLTGCWDSSQHAPSACTESDEAKASP